MPFLQISLHVGAADPAPYEEALFAAGALSVTLEDAGDDPVLEPAPGTTPLWPHVRVKALFDAAADRSHIEAVLRSSAIELPTPPSFEHVADRIWEREWLKDFRPMRFGERLWICPGGQRPPAEAVPAPSPLTLFRAAGEGALVEAVYIELDPGLAFGTGTHPTTALCLEWLDGADLSGKRVIDYGCGSGVLAIAALKLGAREALAVDIDPQALLATRDNAERNGVTSDLRVGEVSEIGAFEADVLLANILAEPLTVLAARFAELVPANGHIVLSGILVSQASEVARSYAPWFDIAPAKLRDDWVRLDGTRRPS